MCFCFVCILWETKVPVDIVDLKVFEPVEKLPNMELKAGGTSLSNMQNKSPILNTPSLFTCGKVAKEGLKLSSARDLNVALVCYREA